MRWVSRLKGNSGGLKVSCDYVFSDVLSITLFVSCPICGTVVSGILYQKSIF